jgi:hypothetical protein
MRRLLLCALAVAIGLGIGARVRADLRSLDDPEVKDIARAGAYALKTCPKFRWADQGKASPRLAVELASTQSEGKGQVLSAYELKLRISGGGNSDCDRSVRLEKRLGRTN